MILMAAEGPLNQSIGKAQRHYSSLFFLPSLKTAVIAVASVCILTGVISAIFFQSSLGLFAGLLLGISLFTISCSSDLIISHIVLKDPIFVLRRVLILSLCGWLFWFFFILLSVVLSSMFGLSGWVGFCLFGFSVILTLRTIVFFATSSTTQTRRLIAILLQPLSCIVPFIIFWNTLNAPLLSFLPFLILSPLISVGFGYFFLNFLNNIGKKEYGVPSLPLFRAFMLNWVTSHNTPLESILEKLGEDADVDVSLLKFTSSKHKAAIVVPLIHPGPFKNIGSSLLPSLLKHAFEKEYGGETCVPLGLVGHERNAASQVENEKIIKTIIDAAQFPALIEIATPFIQVSEGFITASCQIFGKTAVLSLTLAPKTTEDLPQELNNIISKEAKRLGLESSIIINAHNSITNSNEVEATIEALSSVASKCLHMAVSQSSFPFKVGAATLYPKDFTLKEGMGAGGITALTVKVDEQKTAYLVIDGNNMISGLREKILSSIKLAGFSGCEVFTTDTHAVSALVRGQRGYHPVGEAMNQDLLISYIKDCVQTAENKMENCKAGSLNLIIPKIRVMGAKSLEPLTGLVDRSIKKAKQIALPIFGIEGLLLILLLTSLTVAFEVFF